MSSMGVPTLPEDQFAEMERWLGRKLSSEEKRILGYTVHTQPISFSRRKSDKRSATAELAYSSTHWNGKP